MDSTSRDYARIERAIVWLAANWRAQPSLAEIAAQAGLSPEHFDRIFSRWAGVSPLRFARFLTKEYALERLAAGESVLDVAYDSGLSGPGRLHDLLVTCEAVTPGEAKSGGRGVTIEYGFAETPFGECLLASTLRGICRLEFATGELPTEMVARLRAAWPKAQLVESSAVVRRLARSVFSETGEPPRLHLRGTNFQLQVWQALLRIHEGALTTYGNLARAIGVPTAGRAVGAAVGANPVSILVPCHRVIRSTGVFGNYRWGAARKLAICGWETARSESSVT
jgi:O-6-methylguanine DNA methyltransferase